MPLIHIDQIIAEALRGEGPHPIPTGNADVDAWTCGGLMPGSLVVLVAPNPGQVAAAWLRAGKGSASAVRPFLASLSATEAQVRDWKLWAKEGGHVALALISSGCGLTKPTSLDLHSDLILEVVNREIRCRRNRNGPINVSAPFNN